MAMVERRIDGRRQKTIVCPTRNVETPEPSEARPVSAYRCYDHFMPVLRRLIPIAVLLALYWPGVTAWFYQDDFGWLSLRHDVHAARDLAGALFAPKAHGNMRPLGENAYWLG